MTDLEKYDLVNGCQDIESLKKAFRLIFPSINDHLSTFANYDERMDRCYKTGSSFNLITRRFGIRQQLIYLHHYKRYLEDPDYYKKN